MLVILADGILLGYRKGVRSTWGFYVGLFGVLEGG